MKKVNLWIKRSFPLDGIFDFFVGLLLPVAYLVIIPASNRIDQKITLCGIFLFLIFGYSLQFLLKRKKSKTQRGTTSASAWMPLGMLVSSLFCGLFNLIPIRYCFMAVGVSALFLLFHYLLSMHL